MTRWLALLALLAASASAQTGAIRVVADEGVVLVDGADPRPPGEPRAVAPGTYRVSLVDDPSAWGPRRADTTVTVGAGETVALALALPVRVRVETLPIRAVVVRERPGGRADTLGAGPLALDLAPGETAALAATLDGYDAVRQRVDGSRPVVTLVLAPSPQTAPETALLPTERSTARRTWVDVGLGAATVAAGAVAVHFKFRADAVDDRYRSDASPERGDEALRDEALRLDRYSAVALGAMQVGLGVLAVRFVLR